MNTTLRIVLAFAVLLLAGCTTVGPRADASAWRDARQLVLVTTADWDATTGTLRTFVRDDGDAWREQGEAAPVSIGRSGSAWGIGLHAAQAGGPIKREGDGRAPAGVFAIGQAFGYAAQGGTALPYAQMQASSWCMDVVASPLYNRIVDARQVGDAAVQGSSEPMRLDLHNDGDQRYRSGFVIEHNPDARRGAGSCIFAHLWKAPGAPTAGCTAMADATMQRLYGWLRPDSKPVFVLLPTAEYDRLQAVWHLPSPSL
ncbi:L,D-transpeptidase family protein [Luteimonas sp. 22616]|uniref:L,D-transpeptidase family protein n=1 Tax=Luteimonas sp. 22616 TaxID=3453951 RepID=UPI003F842CB9